MKQKLAAAVASVAALASLTAQCLERSYNWKEAAQDTSWANPANWHYWTNNDWQEKDGYPNALTYGAEFWKDATVSISDEETIGELKIGANVVLDGGMLIVGENDDTDAWYEVQIAPDDWKETNVTEGSLEVRGGTLKVVKSNNSLDVGRDAESTATLTVSGGTVEAQKLRLGYGEGAKGTVNLNSGTLSVYNIEQGSGTGEIVFNGGTLQINNNVYLNPSKITLTMAEGGVTFDIPDLGSEMAQIVNAITYASGVTSATLTKTGAGVLALKGATDATKIVAKEGTLKFWDSASVNDKYALELAGGTAADTTFSSIEITAGTYALVDLPSTSASAVTLSGGMLTASADSASPTLSKTVVLNGGTLEITVDNSQEFSISGISLGANGSVNDIVLKQGETVIPCAAISFSGTTLKLRKLTDDEAKSRWLGATESYNEGSNWGAGYCPWTKIFGAYKGARTSVTMDVAEGSDQNGGWKFHGGDFFTFTAANDERGKTTDSDIVISGLEGCGAKIVGGTYVFGNSIYIANEESSCGRLEIASGSVTAKTYNVKVGEKGTGELIVSGGSFVVEQWLGVGESGGTGTLRLSGGSVSVPGIYSGESGTGTVYLDGGTLVATSADGNGLLQASLADVFVGKGGAIIDTGANSPSIKVELKPESSLGAADGGLVKRGAGTLTFDVAPTFTGRVSVEQGVVVMPAGSIEPNGATTFKVTESGRDYFYPLASAVAGDAGVEYPSEAAATAAANNGVAIPSDVAAVLDTNEKVAAYRALFLAEARQVEDSKWFVYVNFTENATSDLGAALTAEFADVDFSKLSSGGGASVTIDNPVAGLYYRLCSGTDVNNLAPGTATLSDGSPFALTLDAAGTCTFYRLNVSTTGNN